MLLKVTDAPRCRKGDDGILLALLKGVEAATESYVRFLGTSKAYASHTKHVAQ